MNRGLDVGGSTTPAAVSGEAPPRPQPPPGPLERTWRNIVEYHRIILVVLTIAVGVVIAGVYTTGP
jgi:hypothetical protein